MRSQDSSAASDLYIQWRDHFLDSLENVFARIADDRFVSQMFHDKSSAAYIPDRITELITFYLNDDRERYTEELFKRVQSIEACFGAERARKLENIGERILEAESSDRKESNARAKSVRALRQELKLADRQLGESDGSVPVERAVTEAARDIEEIQNSFAAELRALKAKVIEKAEASDQEKKNLVKRCERVKNGYMRDIRSAKSEMEAVGARLDHFHGTMTDRNRRVIEEMKQRHEKELEKARAQENEKIELLKVARADIWRQRQEMSAEIDEVKRHNEKLTKDSEIVRREHEKTMATMQSRLSESESSLRRTRAEVAEAERELESEKSMGYDENESLQRQNEQLRSGLSDAEEMIKDVKAEADRVAAENKAMQKRIADQELVRDRHNELVNSMRATLGHADDSRNEMVEQIRGLKSQIADYKSVISHMKNQLRRREERMQKLTASEQEMHDTVLGLNDHIASLRDELQAAQIDLKTRLSPRPDRNGDGLALKKAESRNDELMQEVESRDEQIRSLSHSLLECEKKVSKLAQTNVMCTSQSETFKELCKKQEIELETVRSDILRLQRENWSLKSEIDLSGGTLSMSDFETLESQFAQERDKYKAEITKLQINVSEETVRVAEMRRAIEQVSFEKETLSHTIQDQEREISVIRGVSEKDLREVQATVLSLMKENGDLRQKNLESDEATKSIVRHVCDVNSIEEIPAKMDELRRERDELEEEIERFRRACGQSDIIEFIAVSKEENGALKSWQEAVVEATGCSDVAETASIIANRTKELETMAAAVSDIADVTGGDVSDGIQMMRTVKERMDVFDEREREIAKIVGGYEFEDFVAKLSDMIVEQEQGRVNKQHIESLEAALREDDLTFTFSPEGIETIIEMNRAMERIKTLLPIGGAKNPVTAVEKVVADNDAHRELERKLTLALGCELGDQPLDEAVAVLVTEKHKIKSIVEAVSHELTSPFSPDDGNIPDIVSALVSRIIDLQAQKTLLSDALDGGDDLNTQVKRLVDECADLRTLKTRLADIVHTYDDMEIVCSVRDAVAELGIIARQFGISTGVASAVDDVKAACAEMNAVIDSAVLATGCGSPSKIVTVIEQMKDNVVEAGEFFTGFVNTLLGKESHVSICFPMPEDTKTKVTTIVCNLRQGIEAAEAISTELVQRASRQGYTGTDVLDAVAALEAASAFNTRHECDSKYVEGLAEFRALHDNHKAVSADQRQKYRTRFSDVCSLIADRQARIAEMEDRERGVLLDAQQRASEAETKLDRQFRVMDELLRAMTGKVIDEDFLLESLTTEGADMYRQFRAIVKL